MRWAASTLIACSISVLIIGAGSKESITTAVFAETFAFNAIAVALVYIGDKIDHAIRKLPN